MQDVSDVGFEGRLFHATLLCVYFRGHANEIVKSRPGIWLVDRVLEE